jgi:hypothetical protein
LLILPLARFGQVSVMPGSAAAPKIVAHTLSDASDDEVEDTTPGTDAKAGSCPMCGKK